MKQKEIEARDKELIKKFRTIIQNKKTEENPPPRPFPLGPVFLLTLLILAGLFFLREPQQPFSPKAPGTSSNGEATALRPKALPLLQKEVDKKTALTSFTDVTVQPPKVKPADQKVEKDVKIEEILSCSGVSNRQYTGPGMQFSLAENARPTVWMRVLAKHPPFTLTHVYYCKGEKYCEVPLAIRYHRMRTWSSITLRSADQVGRWRVEVIDHSGAKLAEIAFTVVK